MVKISARGKKSTKGYIGTFEERCTVVILNKENLTGITFEYRSEDEGVSSATMREELF